MSWWDDVFHRAMVAAVLVGLLAGLIGVQVVLRRLSFFTMAMSHATFPGVVAASIIGLNIYLGGAVAGLVVAIGVAALSRARGQDAAAATGVILAGGFALGIGLVATQNGFSRDLSSFLVGSILTVSTGDLLMIAAVLGVVALVLTVGARQLLFVGFDRVGARAAGYRPGLVDLVLLVLIELVIVAVVPVVGTILTLALVVAPAAAGRAWSDRIGVITALAMVFGAVSGVVGLLVSSAYDVAAGAAITLVATAILVLSLIGGHWLRPVPRVRGSGLDTVGPAVAGSGGK
ncbi:metal ABC transporter permease [Micromonospora sp. NBC_01796]|uniref:metal ABC transporter permease n=1 Tax=Micromonospora sp. NBC_01796 TaxID=2975987 RepID=UPI002DD87B0B|nr:metal ABC transporter permease [Micromonospora sp. NBC_01796]WSA86059.1 metal ABC transporter permease [Micromonospora sp. NBC_01796]